MARVSNSLGDFRGDRTSTSASYRASECLPEALCRHSDVTASNDCGGPRVFSLSPPFPGGIERNFACAWDLPPGTHPVNVAEFLLAEPELRRSVPSYHHVNDALYHQVAYPRGVHQIFPLSPPFAEGIGSISVSC
jgi:hypothetical protein